MVLGISRYRGFIVIVSYYWILFNYARLHQFGEGYSAELSNTLIHSLKELMEIQSLVIQNKAFIQSDVSRIIYGIFSWVVLSDYLSGLLFWKENLCLYREMWKSFGYEDNLDFSLFECHCLRQFGLYGYIGITEVFVNGYRSDRMNVVVMWNEMMMMLVWRIWKLIWTL